MAALVEVVVSFPSGSIDFQKAVTFGLWDAWIVQERQNETVCEADKRLRLCFMT
jgi:hypothetical protein